MAVSKRGVILCLVITILLGTFVSIAEGDVVFDAGNDLSIMLIDIEVDAEMNSVIIHGSCSYAGETQQQLILFSPGYNDEAGLFSNGWDTDEITIDMNTKEIEIEISPETCDESPESVSFRVIYNGYVSTPFAVQLDENNSIVNTFAAEIRTDEPPLILEEASEVRYNRKILHDQLTSQEQEMVEYGQAIICLHEGNDEGEYYIPFCTIPAQIGNDGHVTAVFSGAAPAFSEVNLFPLSSVEVTDKGNQKLLVSRLFLSGVNLFFAELSFEIEMTGSDISLASWVFSAPELGGTIYDLPIELFSTVRSTHEKIRLKESNGYIVPDTIDVLPLELTCHEILRVEVLPVEEFGDIFVYFEYFMKDGNSTVHEPFSWKEQSSLLLPFLNSIPHATRAKKVSAVL